MSADIYYEAYLAERKELEDRCKNASFELVEDESYPEEGPILELSFPDGRDKRSIYLLDINDIQNVLKIPFEKYRFLHGYKAICSYQDGEVEALIEPISRNSLKSIYYRLFPKYIENGHFSYSTKNTNDDYDTELRLDLLMEPAGPNITLGLASKIIRTLITVREKYSLSLKLSRVSLTQHDRVVEILEKLANALFFQIDLLFDIPLGLQRENKGLIRPSSLRKQKNKIEDLHYPKNEYDKAPISLYWYGKSAIGMPLLQFLAFYQVIEFYFPIYYRVEVSRKIILILKDPAFRNNRDADIGKIIGVIQQNRSGGFGDERLQLRATLNECIDAELLREFLTSDEKSKNFFSTKTKGLTDHNLPINNANSDLRNDVADRLYDIRCKIVHTKNSSGDGGFELLLPFSKEAEQLENDIALIHYLAQRVLISGSTPLQLPEKSILTGLLE